MHLGHHILTVDQDVRVTRRAQRDVENGATFSGIDALARIHGVDAGAEPTCGGQTHQQAQRFVGDAVFGIVQIEPDGFEGQSLATPRIVGEQLAQMHVFDLLEVFGERTPRRQLRELRRVLVRGGVGHQ